MEDERFEDQGRIGVLIDPVEFSAKPGGRVTLRVVLSNRGLEEDAFRLIVEGIPLSWVSAAAPVVTLSPGDQKEILLIIQPPAALQAGGRHTLTVRVVSQNAPDQATAVKATLTVAAFESPGRVGVLLNSTSFSAAPGAGISIPVSLHNRGLGEDHFEISVRGLPSDWVSIPLPVTRLSPGEEREVAISIRPPAAPHGQAGQVPFKIRVASQDAPDQVVEAGCTLSVAAFESSGRLGVLLASTEFSVVPGQAVTLPITLVNRGLEQDQFRLAVDGIPSAWVSTASPVTVLSPGQQMEVYLTVQPPRSLQSRAGRHAFKVQVTSMAAAYQMVEADCVLTIAVFGQFQSGLHPEQLEAGQPARITVENQGNIQQTFTLAWQSLNDELTFEPGGAQELRVPPGQAGMVEFQAVPRRRPILGSGRTHAYTAQVQSADGDAQNLSGQVSSRPLLPNWVVPAVLIAIMALACCWVLVVLGIGSPDEGPAPTAPPEATAPADTPVPPEEPPTEAPPPTDVPPTEAPPPTEEPPPVEPPTEEPPPEATDEGGNGSGPDLPCLPVAAPLFLVPLFVMQRKKKT